MHNAPSWVEDLKVVGWRVGGKINCGIHHHIYQRSSIADRQLSQHAWHVVLPNVRLMIRSGLRTSSPERWGVESTYVLTHMPVIVIELTRRPEDVPSLPRAIVPVEGGPV